MVPLPRPLVLHCPTALKCALLGVGFGLIFPVLGTLTMIASAGLPLSLTSAGAVQAAAPLLWIIDSAPFWLGLFAWLVGQRQEQVQRTLGVVQQQAAELRARTEEAERAQRAAEEMSRLKSTVLTNMSHELRTPLTGIIGFAEVLAEEVEEEHREFALLIHHSGRRLLDTVNSVLDLAQLESDGIRLRPVPLDATEEVRKAVRLLEPLAQKKGLSLRATGSPTVACLDAGALHRIVTNLVSNAIKFTDAGGVIAEVGGDPEGLTIRVTDTGVGIPAAFLPRLFDEFRQASTGFERSHEGNGLGLAITKRLADLMGGSVVAESEEGEGSTFTVRLPRTMPEPAEAGRGQSELGAGEGALMEVTELIGTPVVQR